MDDGINASQNRLEPRAERWLVLVIVGKRQLPDVMQKMRGSGKGVEEHWQPLHNDARKVNLEAAE
jgi:hypothetical protein